MTLHVRDRVGSLTQRYPVLAHPGETSRPVANKLWSESVGMVSVRDLLRPLLLDALGRPPTEDEIAEATGLTVGQVRAVRDAAGVIASLEQPVCQELETTLGSFIAEEARGPEEEIHVSLGTEALEAALFDALREAA